MTIALDSNKVAYVGNGVTTVFPFSFRVDAASHLQAYVLVTATGVLTLLTQGVDYTVSGVPGAGSVTYNPLGVPLPSTKQLLIVRLVPVLQGLDINNQGGFYPETLEAQLDLMTMVDQQQEEQLGRAVKSAYGQLGYDLPFPAGNGLIGWNAGATALENKTAAVFGAVLIDNDVTLAADSAVGVASQHATKAYADSKIAASVLTTRGDILFRNATLAARLAASTAGYLLQTNGAGADPSWAGFVQAGTGAVTRTWQAKARDRISPKDFGVVGDGVTDDAAAFQLCVTAAAGVDIFIGGLTIRIPTGNEIIVPATGLSLRGKGKIVYEGSGNLFKAGTETITNLNYTATAGQTVFSAAYTFASPYIEVTVNGVLKDHRTYVRSYTGTNLVITFNSGATLNDAVVVKAAEITASGLNGDAGVIVGSGVTILTTQVAAGRAFLLGWIDGQFENREHSRFVMEAGSQIAGNDGAKGFKNAVWIDMAMDARFGGRIDGIGANLASATEADMTACQVAVKITGGYAPSMNKFLAGGAINFYWVGISPGDCAEGIQITGHEFLKVGYAVYWVSGYLPAGLGGGRKFSVGFHMVGSHANCLSGGIYLDGVSEVYMGDNELYQNSLSSITSFDFISLLSSRDSRIHDNTMRSFVNGATSCGVRAGNGVTLLQGHHNTFFGSDATSVMTGYSFESGSADCQIGPDSFRNIATASNRKASSARIGCMTLADIFETQPTAAKYIRAGSDWWDDEKWWLGGNGADQAIANTTWTALTGTAIRVPESVGASWPLTVPAWASRIYYDIRAEWTTNSTGIRQLRMLQAGVALGSAKAQNAAAIDGGTTVLRLVGSDACVAGNVLALQAYQNSGGSLNVLANKLDIKIRFE